MGIFIKCIMLLSWAPGYVQYSVAQKQSALYWNDLVMGYILGPSHISRPDSIALWWHCIINSLRKSILSRLHIPNNLYGSGALLEIMKVNNFWKLSPFVCLRSAVVKILYGEKTFQRHYPNKRAIWIRQLQPGAHAVTFIVLDILWPTNNNSSLESLTKGFYNVTFHLYALSLSFELHKKWYFKPKCQQILSSN